MYSSDRYEFSKSNACKKPSQTLFKPLRSSRAATSPSSIPTQPHFLMTPPLLQTGLETGAKIHARSLNCAQFYKDDAFAITLLGCISRIFSSYGEGNDSASRIIAPSVEDRQSPTIPLFPGEISMSEHADQNGVTEDGLCNTYMKIDEYRLNSLSRCNKFQNYPRLDIYSTQ